MGPFLSLFLGEASSSRTSGSERNAFDEEGSFKQKMGWDIFGEE